MVRLQIHRAIWARRSYYRLTTEHAPTEVAQLVTNYASHPPHPSELPKRLATRVRALETLPFIVGTNPYISKTLHAFKSSFVRLASYPPVRNLEENAKFVSQLEALVKDHANDIPTLAKGFQECARYMPPNQIADFLDRTIRNRISIRLIAEQHIALSHALESPTPDSAHVGVVDMACSPVRMIRMCGSFVSDLCEATYGVSPKIEIDGHPETTFAYIPVHLEYVLTEVLKNAFRATVETHFKRHGAASAEPISPILITISRAAVPDYSHRTFLSLRIRDRGGGVSPSNMAKIFSYAFTTAGRAEESGGNDAADGFPPDGAGSSGDVHGVTSANMFGEITSKGVQVGMGTIAGLGYGLPMARLYATYFGGSLDLLSLDGWGSDVFVKLRCLDEAGGSEI